jgi:hypothetical protein
MSQAALSPELERTPLRRLAITVSRGTSNNLFQVATLVRAATALEATVDVLFQGPALRKLVPNRLSEPEWSSLYARVAPSLAERLRSADFSDMETFLRDAKEHGDDVHYWASAEGLASEGLALDQLTSLLDGARDDAAFRAAASAADALLDF